MSERDELDILLDIIVEQDAGKRARTLLKSDWLAREKAEAAANELLSIADGTRFPGEWILFVRTDGSGYVTVDDLLRETAERIRKEAGLSARRVDLDEAMQETANDWRRQYEGSGPNVGLGGDGDHE